MTMTPNAIAIKACRQRKQMRLVAEQIKTATHNCELHKLNAECFATRRTLAIRKEGSRV